MTVNRREFLLFLGAVSGTAACSQLSRLAPPGTQSAIAGVPFQPIPGPIPLPFVTLSAEEQIKTYSRYNIADNLTLPEGFTYDLIAAWGDPLGTSRIGYNNDYLALLETGENQALLAINFEYISARPWLETFTQVVGKTLPIQEVNATVQLVTKAATDDQPPGLNAFALAEGNLLKAQIKQICREALIDQGIGVIGLQRNAQGHWQRGAHPAERRITGMSGLEDGHYLKATGPATLIFQKQAGQGYIDKLGDRIIGTFQNCAGGQTPWGTILSAEENVQVQIPEAVYADGTSFPPGANPFNITDEELTGLGNVFGLAGNKYGWMVEVDPANPNDYGTKHTWLGRYRHEAVGVRVLPGKPLAFYSGCDRRGGHLYKFLSRDVATNLSDKANSQLLANGMLYAAQFNPDGTGQWIALSPQTPVNPQLPSVHSGGMIPLPLRPGGGFFRVKDDAEIAQFKAKYKNLGTLYTGTPQEQQGAILIDAHYAANAAGATCTARPEDTEISPDGSLFITFTSGGISKQDGSPDRRIFTGPDGSADYEYGWIMQLTEADNDPAAQTFRWKMVATGGEPASGGQGFANPDNLTFDSKGNLWMVTDMSSDKMNRPVRDRTEKGAPMSQSNLRGIFGNNALWWMPLRDQHAGQLFLFGMGPMDSELTGPCFTADQKTLFLSVQHPGEINGTRRYFATEERPFALRTLDGQAFMQQRQVPIGSNWPGQQANDPPKPAIVAIRRVDGQSIV